MSGRQKVFLIGSCVFFAATIYSMFFLKLIFIIICFTLHSIFLLLFCYVCYSDQMDKEISLKTHHQEVGMEIAEKEKELTEAKGQVKMKESLLEQVRSQIEVLRSQNTSFKNEATDLHSRIRKLEEEKKEKERELQNEREERERAARRILSRAAAGRYTSCAISQDSPRRRYQGASSRTRTR